jgi:hypothetical protein
VHFLLLLAKVVDSAITRLANNTDTAIVDTAHGERWVKMLETSTHSPDTLAAALPELGHAAVVLLGLGLVTDLAHQAGHLTPLANNGGTVSLLDKVLDGLGDHDVVKQGQEDSVGHAADTGAHVEGSQAVRRAGRGVGRQRGGEGVELRLNREKEQTG